MRRKRKNYTSTEKVGILREHLVEKVAISDICDKYGLQPTVFYRWQKELFENGAVVFERRGFDSKEKKIERKISTLEEKLVHKDSVIAQIMEDHVKLKKELGEL